jgi:predicted Rossmann fold flavoprotein
MAAIFAASGGADTLLVERTNDGGRKILISGGGRCNILPAQLDESRFITDSPAHLVRRIVRSWPLREQRAFFERDLALPLVEEPASGKLFPKSQSAREVRDRLLVHAHRKGVSVMTGTVVTGVEPSSGRWMVSRHDGQPLHGDAVVLATGGLSVPKTGSDGLGLAVAGQLGHVVNPTYPALTPLIGPGGAAPFADLSGLSLPVAITARSATREARAAGGFLFTHQGYSGPSVLDVSHVAVRSLAEGEEPARLTVQWTTRRDAEWEAALRPRGTRTVYAALSETLPHRLAAALLSLNGVDPRLPLAQLGHGERRQLIDTLVRGPLPWTGDEGYKKAEVTGGGVSLSDVDPATMESRRHRGLFLCGEMLDAFGPIGGYNFLWAWATGRAAGIGAARRGPP